MRPEAISLRTIFEAVEEPDALLFRMHTHPNTNCPVGRTIKGVLDGKLNAIRTDMLDEMERVTLADLYHDMKERLAVISFSCCAEKTHRKDDSHEYCNKTQQQKAECTV